HGQRVALHAGVRTAAAGAVGGGDGEVKRPVRKRRTRQGAVGGKRQALWQCAGSDREVVGRGAAAGGQRLGIQGAADSGGQRRRRQRDAGGIDHERVMLVSSEAEIVGSGDGEVEAACGGRRARQRAVAGEGQAGRQRAQADGEGVRRG